jgi:hypothetical protein
MSRDEDEGGQAGTDRFVFVDDVDTLSVALDTLADCQAISLDAEGTLPVSVPPCCRLQAGPSG